MTRSTPAHERWCLTAMTQPLPPTETEAADPTPPRRGGTSLAAGVALVLLALVLFGGSRVIAAGQRHAYDPGARPPAAYHVTSGKTYQLSSPRSVAQLKKAGLLGSLECFITTGSGEQTSLGLASTSEDDRNLHVVATMIAPTTGQVRVSCTGIGDVFIDDADDAGPDRSAMLMLLSIALGLLGVILGCSGGYSAGRDRHLVGHGSR